MPRIRTIKPEAFASESLAAVSLAAERTFFGLSTQADDRGKHRDNAAIITGLLWSLRPDHTAVHIEGHLEELATNNLICRYVGCDGKRYLHFRTWDAHQKINRPSPSRAPVCFQHEPDVYCPSCRHTCCRQQPQDPSVAMRAVSTPAPVHGSYVPTTPGTHEPPAGTLLGSAGTLGSRSSEVIDAEGIRLDASSGTTTLIPASPVTTHDTASESSTGISPVTMDSPEVLASVHPLPRRDPSGTTAADLIAEWLRHCAKRPPASVIGQVGKQLATLLGEGISSEDLRRGLADWHTKGLHPATLPSVVNATMNAVPHSHHQIHRSSTVDYAGMQLLPRTVEDLERVQRFAAMETTGALTAITGSAL